jgi:hypothetical protein
VQGVIAGLFLAGSGYLWVSSFRAGWRDGADAARQGGPPASFARVAAVSFGVVFLAELGRHPGHRGEPGRRYAPLAVFAGATLGLWAVAAAAVGLGLRAWM